MKEKIYNARTGMEYVLVGDYYLPALKLPRTRPVGRWGMLHKAYLKLRKREVRKNKKLKRNMRIQI